jgi:hypothetical protein
MLQCGAVAIVHWESIVHCTHLALVVSQTGACAVQSVLLEHPARHVKRIGSQTGAAVPQSAFDRHATHRP